MTARPLVHAFVAALAAAACGGTATTAPPQAPVQGQTASSGLSAAEIEALYWARTDSLRMRFTDADVRFVTGMIGHHAQALVMSRLAPTHGASPAILTLTRRIINAQNDEIALMDRWLEDRDLPVPHIEISGIEMHGPEHVMGMPGMLTQEQLRELDAARGPDFDRLFLTYMIQHHEGAVTMVLEWFASDGAGQDEAAFKLASDIQVDQLTEIERMKSMLNQRIPS